MTAATELVITTRLHFGLVSPSSALFSHQKMEGKEEQETHTCSSEYSSRYQWYPLQRVESILEGP